MKKNYQHTVGVVIVNWNLAEDTIKCIKSLRKNITSCALDIVVVDNGSNKNDLKKLSRLKDAVLIQNHLNLGYAKANNQGIEFFLKKKDVDLILLMNNDAFCVDDFLSLMITELDKNSKIGSVSPLIYYAYDSTKIWCSGGVLSSRRGLMSSDYYHHKSNWSDTSEPYAVDWNTGCVNLIRKSIFLKSGLLSEKLKMYVEDVEFSLRIKIFGNNCVVVPRSKVYHAVSKSSGGKGSRVSRYYISRNTVIVAKMYVKKWKIFVLKNLLNQAYQSIMSKNLFLLIITSKGVLDGLKTKLIDSSIF